jgi:hypothetical protein
MSPSEAKTVLEALANGVDPRTGEVLPAGSCFDYPPVIRALFVACSALETLEKRQQRTASLPGNAGKPWTDEEDEQLKAAFSAGVSAKELAAQHGRTLGAVNSRLLRFGLIQVV